MFISCFLTRINGKIIESIWEKDSHLSCVDCDAGTRPPNSQPGCGGEVGGGGEARPEQDGDMQLLLAPHSLVVGKELEFGAGSVGSYLIM